MVDITEISNDRPETMHIEWVPSNVCNYACSYCIPSLHDGSSGWPDLDKSLAFFNSIHNEVNPNNKMLTISGGEPTLWPKLTEFLNSLNSSYFTALVTNGSRTVRWWEDFIESCQNIHRVSISIHLKYADVDHIINVCKTIHKKVRTTVMVMYDLDFEDKCYEFLEELQKHNLEISLTVKPLALRAESNPSIDYDEKARLLIKNFKYEKMKLPSLPIATHLLINGEPKHFFHTSSMISKKENTFEGWFCEAGTKRLVIWHDGSVFGAQCSTARNQPLGNINDLQITKINGLICKTPYCDCAPDIRIPKRKIIEIKNVK